MSLEIVKLQVNEWEEYKEIRVRALKEEPRAFSSRHEEAIKYPDEKWQQRLRDVFDGKSVMLFAKLNGQIVGMMGAYQDEEEQDKENKAASIFGVFVAKEARGKGIATKLLTQLIDEAKTLWNLQKIHLTVTKEQEAAIRLYEKFGFQAIGEKEELEGDGKTHTELIMERNPLEYN